MARELQNHAYVTNLRVVTTRVVRRRSNKSLVPLLNTMAVNGASRKASFQRLARGRKSGLIRRSGHSRRCLGPMAEIRPICSALDIDEASCGSRRYLNPRF